MHAVKGQFNVEYFVVLTLFLVFSFYLAFRLTEFYPGYLRDVKEEILRSDAYRLSEMLINDDGEPIDWDTQPTVYRIGLSDETENKTNLLSVGKIIALNDTCNPPGPGYETVKKLVGSKHDFHIVLNDTAGSLYTVCGFLPAGEVVAVVRRVVAFDNGNYGKMIVYVWW